MTNTLKVKMTSFKKKNEDEFNVFGILLSTNGKDKDFDAFRSTIDRLTTESTAYNDSLIKAKNGGPLEVKLKNDAKDALMTTISIYANFINGAGIENPDLIIKSGFEYSSTERFRPSPNLNLAAPFGLSVSTEGLSQGELLLSFQLEDPSLVLKNSAELSYDGGKIWTAALFFSGKKVVLKNLTRRTDFLIRVRSFGTYSRVSDYSIPIEAYLP